ncbi:sensor histidine kinase [Corynebacterium pacaense]|uniref:sensor histidine kinase n=1 Tax=Corynebacterium pacaense TaxID=1816684 RepID=UPI0009BC045D|nr:ATP-binding protein [Corynebacterium pacaense]
MPFSDPNREAGIERKLGWLFAVGGCIILLDQTVFAIPEENQWSTWWNVGAWAVVTSFVLLAVLGLVLPLGVLRALWIATPLLFIMLQFLWPLGARGEDAGAVPWIWTLEPPVVVLLLLSMKPVPVLVSSLAISLIPALASLLFLGGVSDAVQREIPVQLGSILYVAIFIGVHARLRTLHDREQAARRQREREAMAAALATEHSRFSRIVHDEVLSVLAAAIQTEGTPPAVLRVAAADALAALDAHAETPSSPEDFHVPTRAAADGLIARLRGVDTQFSRDLSVAPGMFPSPVAEALELAAAEALRNSVRHAGGGANRRVSGRIEPGYALVSVEDDGVGFENLAGGGRLGIRESIHRRMTEVGGGATVHSSPGAGTTVTLTWKA